jgi:hypothetical protein
MNRLKAYATLEGEIYSTLRSFIITKWNGKELERQKYTA